MAKMLIFLAGNRTNGFNKRSDVRCPVKEPPAASVYVPELQRRKSESAHPDAGISGDGEQ
jgi:hypothetical protein